MTPSPAHTGQSRTRPPTTKIHGWKANSISTKPTTLAIAMSARPGRHPMPLLRARGRPSFMGLIVQEFAGERICQSSAGGHRLF
jgi:hypothetical protein